MVLSLYDFASLRRRYLSLLDAISAVNFGSAVHALSVVFRGTLYATIVVLICTYLLACLRPSLPCGRLIIVIILDLSVCVLTFSLAFWLA